MRDTEAYQLDHGVMVRAAGEADIAALTAIKGPGSEAIHSDRLRDARQGGFSYLVLLKDQAIIGYSCLVFRRPAYWSDANDREHLPQIVDLQVEEALRGQGYGSLFIRAIERIAAEAGAAQVFLSVEPADNPRAYALYRRLGYQPLQSEPCHKTWQLIDSAGKVHRGEHWVIDMMKPLGNV